MAFGKQHWTKPRHSIAGMPYDDLGYATHGAMEAMKVLKHLDLRPSQMAGMTLLDYGCGTARVARPLSGLFKKVVAFDPVPECIAEAAKEARGAAFSNLVLTGDLTGMDKTFDVICSVSVMEHLNEADQREMISMIDRVAKPGCLLALWYSMKTNRRVIGERFGQSITDLDDRFLQENPKKNIMARLFVIGS